MAISSYAVPSTDLAYPPTHYALPCTGLAYHPTHVLRAPRTNLAYHPTPRYANPVTDLAYHTPLLGCFIPYTRPQLPSLGLLLALPLALYAPRAMARDCVLRHRLRLR
eukprot:1967043-Rhodomonas_salina.1